MGDLFLHVKESVSGLVEEKRGCTKLSFSARLGLVYATACLFVIVSAIWCIY
jgi:hypothetical protein